VIRLSSEAACIAALFRSTTFCRAKGPKSSTLHRRFVQAL
jgi:hypothetical protein